MPVAASPFIHQRNELILRAWEMGMDTVLIAKRLEMSRSAVLGVVHRARVAGDDRAVSRTEDLGDRVLRGRMIANPLGASATKPAPSKRRKRLTEEERRANKNAYMRDYMRGYSAKRRAERLAAAYAYADGSAWDRASA